MSHSLPRPPGEIDAQRIDLALVGILLLALVFRIHRIDMPFVDAHSWRQVTNADVARHFATDSLNIFRPHVSWGGEDGIVGMEFPLLHWITGLAWRVTGESVRVARLIVVSFSLTAVWLMYLLGARLFGRPVGRAAAFLIAVSPGVVFFGRSLLSDTPMLTLSIAAVLSWDMYLKPIEVDVLQPRGSFRAQFRDVKWAIVGAVTTALAGLVKLPAILLLGAVAGLAWSHRGFQALRDRALIAGVVGALLAVVVWYVYADSIYQRTGLTQAVFRPSGTYSSDIAPGTTFVPVSHWAMRERLLNTDFWLAMTDRLFGLFLTPYGFLAALLGIWIARTHRSGLAVHIWALAGLALVVVAAEGQFWHEFHTLPIVPPLILYAALAASPLFDGRSLSSLTRLGRWSSSVAIAIALVLVSIQTFRGSGVLIRFYRAGSADRVFLEAGGLVRSMTADERMVTVDYDEVGTNSPMMLYFAHRQGWSFDVNSISAEVIEHLRSTKGARYFVTTCWRSIRDRRPDVAAYLSKFAVVGPPVPWPEDWRLFDLR